MMRLKLNKMGKEIYLDMEFMCDGINIPEQGIINGHRIEKIIVDDDFPISEGSRISTMGGARMRIYGIENKKYDCLFPNEEQELKDFERKVFGDLIN